MALRRTALKKSIAVAALASGLAFGQEEAPSKEDRRRSEDKRVSVMGPAAAAGAAIGAAVSKDNRAKGAIMGAAVGGLAGLIFDQIMKKNEKEAEAVAPAVETR